MKSSEGSLIMEMPERDRPRERLERLGPSSLTDAELLAILIRTGRQGVSAIQVGDLLLKQFGSLSMISRSSVAEIARVKGIGKAKAVMLKAAFALHERVQSQGMESSALDHPAQIYQLMSERLVTMNVEILCGLALDSKLRLIRCYEVSRGLLNQTLVHAREVFREAISASAAHQVLVHNHPSGDPKPSADDVRTTREMMQAGIVLGIPLLDHVIIGRPSSTNPGGYVSLKELGIFER